MKDEMRDILLIIGNGLSIDLYKSYFEKLNPSKPMDWDFHIDQDDKKISWQEAFPRFHMYFKENIVRLDGDYFKIFSEIKLRGDFKTQIEARHFLALAYTHHARATYIPRIWKWSKFIRSINPKIHTAISFNYDSCIEYVIGGGGGRKNHSQRIVLNSYEKNAICIFKPHGCRTMDMDPRAINLGKMRYPLNNFAGDNDAPFIILDHERQNCARTQSYCILPYERNLYEDHQWQDKIWLNMKENHKEIKNCIIIGHSYGEVDRPEINRIVCSLPHEAKIHICDPLPSVDLEKYLQDQKRTYIIYRGKKETPPLLHFQN